MVRFDGYLVRNANELNTLKSKFNELVGKKLEKIKKLETNTRV